MAKINFNSIESLKGDIFIIPNSSASLERETVKGYNIDFWADINSQYNILKWREKKEGFENSEFENEEFVELWFTNETSENWYDHGIFDEDGTQWRPLTKYLPKTLFKGKQEGDKVSFLLILTARVNDMDVRKRISVEMTLSQTKYRYKNKGKFEDVLKLV